MRPVPSGLTASRPDDLPVGAEGLRLETVLNGEVVQSAAADMIFDVAELVAGASEGIVPSPGAVIVTGTPGAVGHARTPPLNMASGDLCEVRIEGLRTLSNCGVDEVRLAA